MLTFNFNQIKKHINHSLFKSTLIYTLCDVLNKGAAFLILPILSYHLLPADFGIISNFNVISAIFTIFITLGVDGAIAVNFYRMSKIELGKYIFNSVLLVCLSLFLCIVIVLLFSDYIFVWTKIPLNYQLVIIAMATFSVFTAINLSIWRLEEKSLKFGLYNIFLTVINIGFSLIFVLHFDMKWIGRVNGVLISSIFFGFYSLIFLIKKGYLISNFNKIYFKDVFVFCLPLIPHTLSFWIRSGIDRIYITRFIGEAEAGLYSTGFQFGILISFLTLSFNNAFVPYLYKMLSEKNELILIKNKVTLVKLSYLVIFGIILFSIFFIFLSNIVIQQFFSYKYQSSRIFIFWAILSQMFQGFYLIFVNYIFFIKKTRSLAVITFFCSLLQLFLSYFLIKKIGSIGGAYSTVVVSLVNFIVVAVFTYKIYPMPWFNLKLLFTQNQI